MKSKTRSYLIAFLAIYLFSAAGFASLNAQTALGSNASPGWNWKSQPQIDQILQQELTETDNALSQPNLTDWASASYSAYRSLLVFTQEELQQGKQDVLAALQTAFERMKTEPVSNATARSWVIDDMDAKKNELIVRLSEN